MKRLFLLSLTLIMLMAANAEAAFDRSNGPRILLAEIASYGQYELKPEFMDNFYDVMLERLQSDFDVESRIDWGEEIFDVEDVDIDEAQLFSTIHMDAIAHSHLYRRELANVKMTRYGDSVMGKDYYQDAAKTKERQKSEGEPYNLTPEIFYMVHELGEKYNVKYMLFCNVRDADVWRKTGGIFGVNPKSADLRGKRVKVEMEYYLINVKTGKVFEGQNSDKRTSLTKNVLIGKYGNNYTVGDMINYVLNDQAEKLVKNIVKKGLKAV